MDTLQNLLIEKCSELGLKAYPLEVKNIPVENRIRLKCSYGCPDYGKSLSCPPHVMEVDEFRKILNEYNKALLLIDEHKISPECYPLNNWSCLSKKSFHKMIEIEHLAFHQGFIFSLLMRPGPCNECDTCNEKCKKPQLCRFPPEAVGINIAKTLDDMDRKLAFCEDSVTKCIGILLIE